MFQVLGIDATSDFRIIRKQAIRRHKTDVF